MRQRFLAVIFACAIGTLGCDKSTPAAPDPPVSACMYTLSATTVNVSGSGGTSTISVTTGGACTWTSASSAAFITVAGGGTGSGTATVTVAANSGAARSGTATIAGQAVTVNQEAPAPSVPLIVLDASGTLAAGFDIFVNTDRGRTDWLSSAPEGLLAAYPAGQQFGFIACVLAGASAPGSRPSRDLSVYRTLQVQLRGAAGGETVEIGIKDNTDPDNGTETKKAVTLTAGWQTFSWSLSDFSTADSKRLYLLFELVFSGSAARSVFVRDVRYVP